MPTFKKEFPLFVATSDETVEQLDQLLQMGLVFIFRLFGISDCRMCLSGLSCTQAILKTCADHLVGYVAFEACLKEMLILNTERSIHKIREEKG